MTYGELLDWLAIYEISPWGPERSDKRAAIHSLWSRGVKFDDVAIDYPHVETESGEIDDDLIAMLDADAAESGKPEPCPS